MAAFSTQAGVALKDQRDARKLPPYRGYDEMKDKLAEMGAALRAGTVDTEDARDTLLESAAAVTVGIPVATWSIATTDASEIQWPNDWVDASRMHVLWETHIVKQEGSPWSYIQLLAVAAFPPSPKSAALSRPAGRAYAAR